MTSPPQVLLANRGVVDYQSMVTGRRVLFLGEHHHSQPIREEVIRLMPLLRDLGFTHFAMEMFHSASQKHLDYYSKGHMTRADVIRQEKVWLENTKLHDDPNSFLPDPSIYPPYFDVADAAIASGLAVVGIEWCRWDGDSIAVHQRENWEKIGLTEEVIRAIAKEDGTDGNLMSEVHYDIFQQHSPVRNWNAARVLRDLMKDPGVKIATLGGRKHYGYMMDLRNTFSVNRLLEMFTGVKGAVVYYAAPQEPKTFWKYREGPDIVRIISDAADSLGLGGQKFMLEVERTPAMDTPDFIVHLEASPFDPQIGS